MPDQRRKLLRSRRLLFEPLEARTLMASVPLGDIYPHNESDVAVAVEPLTLAQSSAVLAQVNTTDLDLALSAGMQHLQNILDADNNELPFFYVWALTKAQAQAYGDPSPGRDLPAHMKFERHLTSNAAGRGLHAMLLASSVTGIPLDPDVYEAYRSTVLRSLHRPQNGNWSDTSPANQMITGLASDPRSYGSLQFDLTFLFNMGAGMRGALGLSTLSPDPDAILDGYEWSARELFEVAVYNLRKYYVYGGGDLGGERVYNWETFRAQFGLEGGNRWTGIISEEIIPNWTNLWQNWSDPFLINVLVTHYEATGHQPSLELAKELRDNAFYPRFPLNPAATPFGSFGHMFEVVGEMNAYSRLALVTGDADMMQRVRVRYEALRGVGFNSSGWVPENFGYGSDVGEVNNTAELIETALNFVDWGWTEYYTDVERFTRGQLLPAQLLDTSIIQPNPVPQNDGQRDVETRMYGAFGFPAPYGHVSTRRPSATGGFFTDITAGAVSTLAEIRTAAHQYSGGVHYINLQFDTDNPLIHFESVYTNAGRAWITPKVAGDVRLRLPDWADRAVVAESLSSQGLQFDMLSDAVLVHPLSVGTAIYVDMPLKLQWVIDIVNTRAIATLWSGDSIVAMNPMGTPLQYFADTAGWGGGPPSGDYDFDHDIDQDDVVYWRRHYGATSGVGLQADGNKNGVVDTADYVVWRKNLGASPPSPTLVAGPLRDRDASLAPAIDAALDEQTSWSVDRAASDLLDLSDEESELTESEEKMVDLAVHTLAAEWRAGGVGTERFAAIPLRTPTELWSNSFTIGRADVDSINVESRLLMAVRPSVYVIERHAATRLEDEDTTWRFIVDLRNAKLSAEENGRRNSFAAGIRVAPDGERLEPGSKRAG